MQKTHPQYERLQLALEGGDLSQLDHLHGRELFDELSADERRGLCSLFIKRAEAALEGGQEDLLVESCMVADELAVGYPEALLEIASVCYRFSVVHKNKKFAMVALATLRTLEEKDPFFLASDERASHLMGKLFDALYSQVGDESLLEKAVERYTCALDISKDSSRRPLLFWDLGDAWTRLGVVSKEESDLRKAVDYFSKAALATAPLPPHFWVDYGHALMEIGKQTGDSASLKEALEKFQKVIAELDALEERPEAAYEQAFFYYALCAKALTEVTFEESDLLFADKVFEESLAAVPEESDLWLHWGELFLNFGWLHKEASWVDKGLEKLSSACNREASSFEGVVLFAQGLAMLGVLLEDFRLLKESEKHLTAVSEKENTSHSFQKSYAFLLLGLGLYFSDETYLKKAIKELEKSLSHASHDVHTWYRLFEAGFSLAEITLERKWAKRCFTAIERTCELRAHVSLFFSEWGVALLRLRELHRDPSRLVEQAVGKFKQAVKVRSQGIDLKGFYHYGIALDLVGERMEDEGTMQEAIEVLKAVLERKPHSLNVAYHLAVALVHHGALTGEWESYHHAIDLLRRIVRIDCEDEVAFCDLGFALLHFSQEEREPLHSDESSEELLIQAEQAFAQAAMLGNKDAFYPLACLEAKKGECVKAIDWLEKAAVQDALPELQELLEDEWLNDLRETAPFREFLLHRFG